LDEEFLKLALIHETVRYALDSRYDLAKLRQACQDAEEWFALEAFIEGRAQWVTRQIARRLGKEEFFPLLADRFLHVPDQHTDPALRTISQSVVHRRQWAYEKGLAFFEYVGNQGLGDVEKQALSKPPKLTKWIEEPELYVKALKGKRPDLATILTRLEKIPPRVPPPGDWKCQQQSYSAEMMSQAAALFADKNLLEKIADSWQEARSLVWTDGGRQVAVSLVRFQTPAAARAYEALILDIQRQREEIASGAMRSIKSQAKIVGMPGLEENVQNDLEATIIHSKPIIPKSPVPPDCVLEITWFGMDADTLWAEQVVSSLLATDQ
jgi:hypothetical protein